MSRKVEDEKSVNSELSIDFNLMEEAASLDEAPVLPMEPVQKESVQYRKQETHDEGELINCLRNEIIEVRFIPQLGKINDPKHVMYGGLGENSKITISVPRQRSGAFINVLTNSEKAYLEYIMGLEKGALSVYNKHNNFWSNTTEGGISKVILQKRDNRLNLNDPEDYIRYKILLSDKEHIAPNLQTLHDKPKATYRFVLVSDNEFSSTAKSNLSFKQKAYMEYGKIEEKYDVLKTVLEILSMKPVSKNSSLEYLQTQIAEYLDGNPKTFLQVVKDPQLATKILIKKAVSKGIIAVRTGCYYLKDNGVYNPLCDANEDATLSVAAKYLDNPENQVTKAGIEAQLNYK